MAVETKRSKHIFQVSMKQKGKLWYKLNGGDEKEQSDSQLKVCNCKRIQLSLTES